MRIFNKDLTANFSFAVKTNVEAVSCPMNEATFEEIYEKTVRPLLSYVARISGNSALADDIVQETFLRYLRAPLKVEDDAVKSYLYKIATNLVYDHFRQTKRASRWQILLRTQPEAEIVDDNFAGETEPLTLYSSGASQSIRPTLLLPTPEKSGWSKKQAARQKN